MYDFETRRVNREIRKRKAKRVLLQFPEGLKPQARQIMDALNAECVLSADACFGACDTAHSPECDLTVHFGHTGLHGGKVIYVPANALLDVLPAVSKALKLLPEKKLGLITTAQHLSCLKKVSGFLKKKGKAAVVGGQVLGCNVDAARKIAGKVDAFLFIGSGEFHAQAVAAATGKKVVKANPYSNAAEVVKTPSWEKEKWLRVSKAADARTFGVVVCSKPGQKNWKAAEQAKRSLEKTSRAAYFVLANEITPDKLDYLPFDAFVITACPRIVLDDWKNYKKAVLLPSEAELV